MSDETPVTTIETTLVHSHKIEDGKVYNSVGPNNEVISFMTEKTWVNVGTNIQSMRNALANQDRRIKELLAENKLLTKIAADDRSRLENLRAIRRAEKRPEVEEAINLEGGFRNV